MPKIQMELTPFHLRCTWGGCQAVHLLSDGKLLIIGKQLPDDLMNQIESKVGDDEFAIVLDAEYLEGIPNGYRSSLAGYEPSQLTEPDARAATNVKKANAD